MSSDGEKKLTPAEIAYPSARGGDGYVDHYVGQRRQPDPEPAAQPTPPTEEPASSTPSSNGSKFRWGVLLLAVVVTVGFLAKDRLMEESPAEHEDKPQSEIVLRIVSDPPARVYRRQLELGVTPIEVARDESGTELKLSMDGYQSESVTFEGASPGEVKEVRVKLKPAPSAQTSAPPSPVAEPTPPRAPSPPAPSTTPAVATQITSTPSATPTPKAAPAPPKPKPVAAQPPPPPRPAAPVYQPPPRRVAPPPPPRQTGTGSHRITPPDI